MYCDVGSYHKDLPFIGTKKGGLMTSRPRQLRPHDDQVGPGKYNTEDALKKTWSNTASPHISMSLVSYDYQYQYGYGYGYDW
jgi:hypothetical protein